MTVTATPPVILLSDKFITVNNFTTLVLVKLDIDEMNYSSWVYFFKILCKGFEMKSIATILTSLGSPIGNDDMVTIALKEFPDKYDNVSGIIVHREPFSDLKTVRSMLTTEEIRLKSRAQATSIVSHP
ncbi:hypothetical protein Tco_0404207 [Tanacetum coccineum]